MTKKEKYLYLVNGKRYNVIIRYYITYSYNDTENVLKCNSKILEESDVVINRTTKKIRMLKKFIYLNKYVGGIYEKSI